MSQHGRSGWNGWIWLEMTKNSWKWFEIVDFFAGLGIWGVWVLKTVGAQCRSRLS